MLLESAIKTALAALDKKRNFPALSLDKIYYC